MQSLFFPGTRRLPIELRWQGPAIRWLGAGKEAATTASSLFLEASKAEQDVQGLPLGIWGRPCQNRAQLARVPYSSAKVLPSAANLPQREVSAGEDE